MLAPVTMRLCNNAIVAVLLFGAALSLSAQKTPTQPAPAQAPPLTVDRDPVRSPDATPPATPQGEGIRKEAGGFVLHTDVEEVVLKATPLAGKTPGGDLQKK